MRSKRILVTGGSGFIGIHLVAELESRGHKVFNLDVQEPLDGAHLNLWIRGSVLDLPLLHRIIKMNSIDCIIHLAALAKQNAASLEEFGVNIQGTRNIIDICNKFAEISKVIFTSTQYVNQPGQNPPTELINYVPYGYYGESKLINEMDINSDLRNTNWTIIRPTAIWGRFHPVLVDGLWYQIYQGRYLHPSRDCSVKPYGYVKNTVWQISEILDNFSNESKFQTYYLADTLMFQNRWVRAFVDSLGAKYREVPRLLLFVLSKFGDLLKYLNLDFPLYSSRYSNLVQSNPIDISLINELVGLPPYDFEVGVLEVTNWLKDEKWNLGKIDV